MPRRPWGVRRLFPQITRAGSALSLALLVSLAAADDVTDLLMKGLQASTKVTSIAVQKRPEGPGQPRMVKVFTSPSYGQLTHYLQPLDAQGLIVYDDRKVRRTFFPDDNKVIEETSNRTYQWAPDRRIALIRQNYTVRMGERTTIAGRSANEVRIIPRYDSVATHRMWIDRSTGFVLRYIIEPPTGAAMTVTDTVSVEFPRQLSRESFRLPLRENTDVVRLWGPQTLASVRESERFTRINPPLPRAWPDGFRMEGAQIIGTQTKPILAIRLTDGMTPVSVYIWNTDQHERSPFRSGPVRLVGVLGINALGGVREDLLKSCVSAVAQSAEWAPERNDIVLTLPEIVNGTQTRIPEVYVPSSQRYIGVP